jgi:hypothetical protein
MRLWRAIGALLVPDQQGYFEIANLISRSLVEAIREERPQRRLLRVRVARRAHRRGSRLTTLFFCGARPHIFCRNLRHFRQFRKKPAGLRHNTA